MFEVRKLSVARSGKPVVRSLYLSVTSPGALTLIGPGGAGKSSLLQAVAGELDAGMSVSGAALLDGLPCHTAPRGVGWYRQHTGIEAGVRRPHGDAERRAWSANRLRALRTFVEAPRSLYVLDEPTAGMTEDDALQARAWLKPLSERSFVLMATHDRRDCLALGGMSAIFDAGAVVEAGRSDRLFAQPRTEAGRHYVETGHLAGFGSRSREQSVDGIWWVVPGVLCGMSRPGLVAPAERQFSQLADAGVRHLVTLEEEVPALARSCSSFGIVHHHFHISDMDAPDFEQALAFCRLAEEAVVRNEGIAFHCRGGLGRTGTAIATVLIWYGEPVASAIARVRGAQAYAIQSQTQTHFLHQFADRLSGGHLSAVLSHS